ncbi:MAG: glycosyltransferase, partial [Oscillospiraceae bacterium]|nr:glycosyltransferase [Oscillospiraceae bacterium]
LEIIVVDDGSTDRTPEIVLRFAKEYPGLVRLHRQPNSGPAAARNTGLLLAQGRYVGFVDADDWVEPDMYQALLEACEDGDADMAGCGIVFDGVRRVEIWGSARKEKIWSTAEIRQEMLPRAMCEVLGDLLLYNKLYRRDFWEKNQLRLPEDVRLGEDNLFVSRCLAQCTRFAVVPRLCYHYVTRPGSLTHQRAKPGLRANRLLIYAHMTALLRACLPDPEEALRRYRTAWVGALLEICVEERGAAKNSAAFCAQMISLAGEPSVAEVLQTADAQALQGVNRLLFNAFAAHDWVALEALTRRRLRLQTLQHFLRWFLYHLRRAKRPKKCCLG